MSNTNIFHILHIQLNLKCHSCYFWWVTDMTVTGMTVTGMTKSMQTYTYFAFWRQKLENVYTTILMSIILF